MFVSIAVPHGDGATRLANALLDQKLVASVNIVPGMHSF
jgi:uncharacterized protein involved in tolerance to divalent cations